MPAHLGLNRKKVIAVLPQSFTPSRPLVVEIGESLDDQYIHHVTVISCVSLRCMRTMPLSAFAIVLATKRGGITWPWTYSFGLVGRSICGCCLQILKQLFFGLK